ncbi:uncharacterized protein KD926_011073 [Aspergillus affinis]|uniref:uncharacterized protein n=1 Tax=Aspergillus affinis TaxID=1070780 RepID=UPI0022FEDF82|nr:uncharacterized protein KD926_011073 [Aspergillus affinis]KAI9044900.1 hypothetical protein KD926_011073 [Aspergillus affinis]
MKGKMNAPCLEEISQAINPRSISPPPQYSLHEPSRTPQVNGSLTDRTQQISLSTDDNLKLLTTSTIVPDEVSTNCWSDEATARVVLSLLQKEPLSPLPHPITQNDIKIQNKPLLTCVVCFETYRDDYFPSTPIATACDHTSVAGTDICLGCLRRCLDIQFSSQDTSTLSCPLCHEQLSDEEVQRWASRQTFHAYDRMRTWQMLEEDAEFVPCIRQSCGYGQLHAGGLEDPIVRFDRVVKARFHGENVQKAQSFPGFLPAVTDSGIVSVGQASVSQLNERATRHPIRLAPCMYQELGLGLGLLHSPIDMQPLAPVGDEFCAKRVTRTELPPGESSGSQCEDPLAGRR